MQDAELNRRQVETTLERGRKALKASQWEASLDVVDELVKLQPSNPEVVDFIGQVVPAVTKQIRQTIAKGRLDQADLFLNRVRRHAGESIEVQELKRVVDQCRDVAATVRASSVSDSLSVLKTLKQIVPEARWLDGAIKDAEQISRSYENLRTGPLGSSLPNNPADTIARPAVRSTPPMRVFEASPVIPDNFMIHLDGTGSVLVTRGNFVTIGSPGRSRNVDVPLQGQSGLSPLTIERMEEDYFLSSEMPVPVNGRTTTSTLLNNHDQIRIGRRGSVQFKLPNAASPSAVLDFSGIRLASGNARRVILMSDSLVIGPQPSAHIQSLSLERTMVLHWRNGELRIRPMSRMMDNAGNVSSLIVPTTLTVCRLS